VGQKRVARLMRHGDIQGVSKRRGPARPRREVPEAPPAPDLVKRAFTATAPNQLGVADITYSPTMAGFLYLAVVLAVVTGQVVHSPRRLTGGRRPCAVWGLMVLYDVRNGARAPARCAEERYGLT